MTYSFALCIPTLNPGPFAARLVESIASQTIRPDHILIIDSGSTDGSVEQFRNANIEVLEIPGLEFDHGGTRNIAFQKFQTDFYIFLTQDAIPINQYSFENLLSPILESPRCGACYGRQVASQGASAFAAHARLFNYPPGDKFILKGQANIDQYGIKTIFCSNSFAVYRRSAMEEIGFFPNGTLFAEDSLAVARMVDLGWLVAYSPVAEVVHSHNYSASQEFSRYFDVGAFHSFNLWLLDKYKGANGEGLRFVFSEYSYLKSLNHRFPFPAVVFKNFIRYFAYQVGRMQRFIPKFLKLRMTTNKSYWIKS
ncbi:glycosyltransferase family 2 protein [Polynucleobacter sp. JS-Polo-80-F4]|uniref:glycosyltransferase family 2 protein n=1 Tax=Polynucleobacter sp. JS-Polo-80-F4 TaxID=2576918 RepID=UPI001C0E8690|nr:glycosyltransferase [Polynucleobacter sp. JS-Polo-80-F4]MBU3616746.1 glycosyltransferase family 2 protein [Polynucleobacter sp. JS-Polo-80-F4]